MLRRARTIHIHNDFIVNHFFLDKNIRNSHIIHRWLIQLIVFNHRKKIFATDLKWTSHISITVGKPPAFSLHFIDVMRKIDPERIVS